jgi:hypothetical protein
MLTHPRIRALRRCTLCTCRLSADRGESGALLCDDCENRPEAREIVARVATPERVVELATTRPGNLDTRFDPSPIPLGTVIEIPPRFGNRRAALRSAPTRARRRGSIRRLPRARARVTSIDHAVMRRLRQPLARLGYRLVLVKAGQASPDLPRSA